MRTLIAGAVAAAVAVGGAAWAWPALARPAAPAVGPVAEAAAIAPGEQVAVVVQVRDVAGLNAADVRLGFDPTVLEVVDADPAADGVQVQLLDGFLRPDFVLANGADNANGAVWFAATQLRPSEPVTGTGDLARIVFRGLAAGSSGIAVAEQRLVLPSGDPIQATTFEAVVAVGAGGPTRTPPPSATATPSATPSPAAIEPTPTPGASATATPGGEPTPTGPPESSVLYCPFASAPR